MLRLVPTFDVLACWYEYCGWSSWHAHHDRCQPRRTMVEAGFHDEPSPQTDQTEGLLRALSRLMRPRRVVLGVVVLSWLGCGGNVGGGTSLATGGGSSANLGGAAATGGLGYAGSTGTITDCSATSCEAPMCPPNSMAVIFSGQCCPSCQVIDPSCAQVNCLSLNCPSGFITRRLPGACCDTCVSTPSATYPNCETVDCAPAPACPLGYHETYPDWSCCGACEPDPNYCNANSDCITATKDTGCCSCPASISQRQYSDDLCYSSPNAPRSVPAYCTPQSVCTVACGACTFFGMATCQNHTCGMGVLFN